VIGSGRPLRVVGLRPSWLNRLERERRIGASQQSRPGLALRKRCRFEFYRQTGPNASVRLKVLVVRSVLMKRLSPEERKYILHQTLVRVQKDWVCRYGQWNTTKLLYEFRHLLRRTEKAGGLTPPDETEPIAALADEELPLFAGLSA